MAEPTPGAAAEPNPQPSAATPPNPNPQADAPVKPKVLTQAELVAYAKDALDKGLEASIPDAAARQAAVDKASATFALDLAEGLKNLPKNASLKRETAVEIITDIQRLQSEYPQWDGKKGDKAMSDVIKDAAQAFAQEQGPDKKTAGDRARGAANLIIDNPGKSAAVAAALTALASKGLPNKEQEQPDGTVAKKSGLFKKALVAIGAIATAALVVEKVKPGAIGGVGKWASNITSRRETAAAAAAAGQAVGA